MFKTKSKLLFTAAILSTFLLAYFIYVAYEKSLSMTDVLVAKKTIEARTVLSPDMFETRAIAEISKHPKAVTPDKLTKLAGKIAVSTIWADETVLAPAVGLEDSEGKPTTLRNENARFFPIALDKPNITSGNIKKGDLVDIVVNFKKDTFLKENVTATVLNLVEVDNVVTGVDGKQSAILVLHPQDAEFISYAVMLGELTFSKADRAAKNVRTTGVNANVYLNRYFPGTITKLPGQP